jgi:cystathionine beta-lyase/cystathionine gamma-synthase
LKRSPRFAKKKAFIPVVDNTFASPYLQNPLDTGADIVMHSVTKYLGGHSDTVMGALVTNDDDIGESPLAFIQNASGAVPGPQDCFLVLRGIENTAYSNAATLRKCDESGACGLKAHPKVGKVYYPGLESHPGHAIGRETNAGFRWNAVF